METKNIVRIILVVLFILFLLCLYWRRGSKGYDYQGIDKVQKGGLLHNFINYINPKKEKKKKRVNKTENMCRRILEKVYNAKFPSVRPKFLKSPRTGKCLELDCYNQGMGIALEYNGAQHYKYTPYFHKNKKNFFSQVHRDDWKRKKCQELGIKLIEIPYWVEPIDLENYIILQLKKKGCL